MVERVGLVVACLLGAGTAIYLLVGKRSSALGWPETMLIGLGLMVGASPMFSEIDFGLTGWKLKKNVQAAADVAKKSADLATENDKRIIELEKKLASLSATTDVLKGSVTDQPTRTKVEAVAKSQPEPSLQEKAAQEATRKIQQDINTIIKIHPNLFKF